jgi:hypothetical protein
MWHYIERGLYGFRPIHLIICKITLKFETQ